MTSVCDEGVSDDAAPAERFQVVAVGVDDVTLGFDMEGSKSVPLLIERAAAVGIVSYAEPWVTRMDVAVDAQCSPADGKLLLDALESVRLQNGWRTRSVGVPRSTVYFSARTTDSVYACAYCRNLKLRVGEPFGLIRLEAEHRFGPKECLWEAAAEPSLIRKLWMNRYGNRAARVTRVAREVQTVELFEEVRAGEFGPQQGERLAMFLDLERLGLAQQYYGPLYVARRREARKLGYSANEAGATPMDVDLDGLIGSYRRAVDANAVGAAASLA